MALVVEDGSIVAGANTYVDLEEFKDYADARGVTLPTSDSELEPMIILAVDYIDSYEPKFKGKRVNPSLQALAWPRAGVEIYDAPFSEGDIPTQLKNAQMQAAILVASGIELMPNLTSYAVRREKVDVIEVEYATGGGLNNASTPEFTPVFPMVESLLKPLLEESGFGMLKAFRA